jgi:glutamate---cysteine ligase / carboxylate-amine ligase
VTVTAAELRVAFDGVSPAGTVGVEEELMLLDPETHDLTPRAPEVLDRLGEDARFKLELPASQMEIVTTPAAHAGEIGTQLAESRRRLAEGADGIARPAGTGLHPFASGAGELNPGDRYEHTRRVYGPVAARQLLCALQVHVAVGGADRTLAVHDALRSHLPEIAALAANAPFHEGRDTGLASARPKVAELLPRQGVPPALGSWDAYAAAVNWGLSADTMSGPSAWWWELRPNPVFGTLEVRVPDAQTTVADAMAIVAVVHALVARLSERHDAGDLPPPAPTWRIEENRWAACHLGVEGTFADLETGERVSARERLDELLTELASVAAAQGAQDELDRARQLLARGGGAAAQREAARDGGPRAVAGWLAERFLA